MIDILLWVVVVIGYLLCFFILIYVFVFSSSLFKDAPFVRSNRNIIKEALKFLDIKRGDKFVDIGSGDGLVVFLASKTSNAKKHVGIELDPFLIFFSNVKKVFSKKRKKISFVKTDAFNYNYKDSTKVYLYLTTNLASKVIEKLKKELPRGSIVVSNEFGFGEKFERENTVVKKLVKDGRRKIYLTKWIKK